MSQSSGRQQQPLLVALDNGLEREHPQSGIPVLSSHSPSLPLPLSSHQVIRGSLSLIDLDNYEVSEGKDREGVPNLVWIIYSILNDFGELNLASLYSEFDRLLEERPVFSLERRAQEGQGLEQRKSGLVLMLLEQLEPLPVVGEVAQLPEPGGRVPPAAQSVGLPAPDEHQEGRKQDISRRGGGHVEPVLAPLLGPVHLDRESVQFQVEESIGCCLDLVDFSEWLVSVEVERAQQSQSLYLENAHRVFGLLS